MKANNNTTGTVKAVVALEVFVSASQDSGKDVYAGKIATASLPWDNEEFVSKLLQLGHKGIVYRSEKAKQAIGLKAGEPITTAQFVAGILATSFRGEATPNKDDKDQAAAWMKAVTSKTLDAAVVLAKLNKDNDWTADELTEELLTRHFFNKRMKAAEVSLDNL